jgi:hypothetical protein
MADPNGTLEQQVQFLRQVSAVLTEAERRLTYSNSSEVVLSR